MKGIAPATSPPAMEKSTKVAQSSAKGTTTEVKKAQDVATNKLPPKILRKREPPGANGCPRYEQPQKYVQKAKGFDKRPKPKGLHYGSPKEDTEVVEEQIAEPGSVVVQGSKKQNLNHLLNFHYEPRGMQGGSGSWSNGKSQRGYGRNSNRSLPPVQRHKYSKEQFLQASCQFVVIANRDYSVYMTDPDMLVDWRLIEQINLYSYESLSCPICLSPPIAGKMTRCGHVYCWHCILHYLSLSNKTCSKCPICYEPVHETDLKSVVEVTHSILNLGDTVTLRLMRREKGSLLPTPVLDFPVPTPMTFFSVSQNFDQQVHSKLLLATFDDVMEIIKREKQQLSVELMEDPFSSEGPYIQMALDALKKREENVMQKKEGKVTSSGTTESVTQSTEVILQNNNNNDQEKQLQESVNCEDNCNNCNISRKDDIENCDEYRMKNLDDCLDDTQTSPDVPKYFYFYQAVDGQHVYLHAVNVKMLEMQYGNLEFAPRVITGKLLEKESGSFTEELRRRLRYLGHLPLTCQFEVAEIELKPPTVSKEVLRSFSDQLETRQKRRMRREREERKRDKKIMEEVNKQMGKFPTPIVHIESRHHFPDWQPELFAEETVPSTTESTATSSVASSPSLNTTLDELASQQNEMHTSHETGVSFAEMLRNTGTRMKSSITWPTVGSANSKPQQSTATRQTYRDLEDEEEYAAAPSYCQSFGDALAQAFERSKLLDTVGKEDNGITGCKKKKKKNKPTVLFATTMARGS